VIELGSAWVSGSPTKSLYQFQVLIDLVTRTERPFHLAQDFYWYNPARLPSPAEWVTVRRIRVKDAVSPVWWLSKTPWPSADNRRVLKAYSAAQRTLFAQGYNAGERPSEHTISADGFSTNHGGAIPPNMLPVENLLSVSNTASNDRFLRRCRELDFRLHPARFPLEIPEFFIRFLTEPGATVVDPFAGSNSVGWVAESLARRWLSCEIEPSYAYVSRLRFGEDIEWLPAEVPDVPRRRPTEANRRAEPFRDGQVLS
jgi:site-specific DNA-methyltransferase (cytosine-N4-specific)